MRRVDSFLKIVKRINKGGRNMKSVLRMTMVYVALLSLVACGGGGGGGGGGVVEPSITVIFTESMPSANEIYMSKNSALSSENVLAIDVKANQIDASVFGAAFDVDIGSFSGITYIGHTKGSFLDESAGSVIYDSADMGGGKIIAGAVSPAGASGATGSGTIITLRFKVTEASTLTFSNNELRDTSNNLISVTWQGGSISTI